MYKVTNKSEDQRKFRDGLSGKDIIVEPRQSVVTNTRIEKSTIFDVEEIKEKIKNKKEKHEEDD